MMEEMVCDTDVSSEFGGVRGLCDGGVQPGRSSLSDPAPLQSQTCRGLWVSSTIMHWVLSLEMLSSFSLLSSNQRTMEGGAL